MTAWPEITPALETERLVLRPLGERHMTETYVGWLADAEVVRFSEQRHRSHDLASCRAYRDGMVAGGHLVWAIETRDARHIGNISAAYDRPNDSADLAILIGERDFRSSGHGTEAWGAVSEFLLFETGVRRLSAGAMAVNDGMVAVFERTGMTLEGRRPRAFLWEGREVDMVLAGRFREDARDERRYLRKVA